MTAFQELLQAIEAKGRATARASVAAAGAEIVARAAALGVRGEVSGDDVVLGAPGLRARAFGSRRVMPDPRLAGLVL